MGLFDWLRGGDSERAEPTALPQPPTDADILASLDRVATMIGEGKASALVRSRVSRVDGTIRAILPKLPQLGLGSVDAYAVMATATDYLPEAVGGYLRLPREWADSRPIDGGRTALMVLVDQLELLSATMTKMLDAANRADAQALIAHGRFLEAKFGASSTGGSLDATGTVRAPSTSEPSTPLDRLPNALDLEP